MPTRRESGVDSMFLWSDVAFSVYPLNRKSKDLLLFPLPLPIGETTGAATSFRIGVALRPTHSGTIFDPMRVKYWIDKASVSYPLRIQGPYACNSSSARPPWRSMPVDSIEVPALQCTYVWLEFPVAAPDPKETFHVQIDGVTVDGADRPIPSLEFLEAKKTESFTLP